MTLLRKIARGAIGAALLALSSCGASYAIAQNYNLIVHWVPVDDDSVLGYRVYEWRDGEKILRYDGKETSYVQPQTETAVFGVVSYNQYGESEIVPRVVVVPHPMPLAPAYRLILEPVVDSSGGDAS